MSISAKPTPFAAVDDTASDSLVTADLDAGSGPTTIAATVSAGAGPATALFLTETGDTASISMNDIHQGQMGDCYLVSSLGDLAATHSDLIKNMIHVNADGTETVTLYASKTGAIPTPNATAFKAITVTVNNTFASYAVNSGAGQDVVNGTKEIWAQVLEKAIATVRGGYSAIAYGGNPTTVMEELTGHTANAYAPGSLSSAMLSSFAKAGDLLAFDTQNSSNLAYNLVGNHAYEFQGIVNTASGAAVSLKNPWGFDQPSLIPVSQMSKVFAEVDVGRMV